MGRKERGMLTDLGVKIDNLAALIQAGGQSVDDADDSGKLYNFSVWKNVQRIDLADYETVKVQLGDDVISAYPGTEVNKLLVFNGTPFVAHNRNAGHHALYLVDRNGVVQDKCWSSIAGIRYTGHGIAYVLQVAQGNDTGSYFRVPQ